MVLFCSGKCTSKARLDGKTAVITGCNTGIGKVTVKDFCKRGGRVIMACRNVDKTEQARREVLEQLAGEEGLGEVVVIKLDLSSLQSVRDCAGQILEQETRVDILVNNAGVMMCPYSLTEDGFEMQFATNHLGHFLFTLLLLPRILTSTPARIVTVSSSAHTWGTLDFDDLDYKKKSYSTGEAYGRSKLANILFTKELARRLEGRGINVYSLHPGVVDTELQRHMDDALFPGVQFLFKTIGSWGIKTPEQGAQTSIYCSVDEKAAGETGLYYSDCKVARPHARAEDMAAAAKLWEVSADLVKLGNYDPFATESQK